MADWCWKAGSRLIPPVRDSPGPLLPGAAEPPDTSGNSDSGIRFACSPPMARYWAQAILLGVTVAVTTAAPAGAQTYKLADHHAYSREIAEAAARHAVPERLVWAVIRAESGFDPRAVSRQGARGLMQLMPETAAMLGVPDAEHRGGHRDARPEARRAGARRGARGLMQPQPE